LFLKGDVEMSTSGEVEKTQDVRAMLEKAKSMEMGSIKDYNMWALECSQNFDSASKRIFEDLVIDEERHYDQFDTEMDNIDRFGERYLALQSIERSKGFAAGAGAEA